MKAGRPSMLLGFSVAVALTAASGCSALATRPPTANASRAEADRCAMDNAFPVIDTVFTVTNLIGVFYVATQDVQAKGARIGLGLTVAGAWAMSARYGFDNVKQCQELKEAYAVEDARPAPRYRLRPRHSPTIVLPKPASATDGAPPAAVPPDPRRVPGAAATVPPVGATNTPAAPPADAAPPALPEAPSAPAVPQQQDDESPLPGRRP